MTLIRVALLAFTAAVFAAFAAPLPPTFTPKGGTYKDCPLMVALKDINPDNKIYYTTDGSMPSKGSSSTIQYSAPISVTQPKSTIKAVAMNAENQTSTVATASYSCSAPAPPTFTPKGGIADLPALLTCPAKVTIKEAAVKGETNQIYFTTDGTTPVPGSGTTKLYSSPVTVAPPQTMPQTIKAVAENQDKLTSSVAQASYSCGNEFVSFKITIEVGDDDARSDSAITAALTTIVLVPQAETPAASPGNWCLKYSNNGVYAPCQEYKAGITWEPYHTYSFLESYDTTATSVSDLETLTIFQASFPGDFKSLDNWDLFSLRVDGTTRSGSTTTLMNIHGPSPTKGGCYARFKHPHGNPSTVAFHFDRSIPDIVWDDDGPHNAPYCKE